MRNRRNRNNTILTIDLAPMVDVVFLLIIFFMLATTFNSLESALPIDLPKAQSSRALTTDMPTITIDKNSRVYIGGQEISLEQIVPMLNQKINDTNITTVVFRADGVVTYEFSVKVMDLIKQSGAKRITLATGGG